MRRVLLLAALLLSAAAGPLAGQEVAARADSAWAAGDTDTAYRLYTELLAGDSTHVTALQRVGLVTAWTERYDDALVLLDRALRLAPDRMDVALTRARVLGWSQRFDEAIAAVDRILEADPDHAEALEEKARYTSWARRYAESLEAYDRLVAREPDVAEHRIARARVLAWDDRLERAAEEFRDVLGRWPDDLDALLGLAQVLSWDARYGEAAALYRDALTADPDSRAALLGLAQVATWSGDLAEGERRWRTMLEGDSLDAEALVGLAANLHNQGRTREAFALLERAAEIDAANDQIEILRPVMERALAPQLSPTLTFASDSDGNRALTTSFTASVPLRDGLELRVAGGRTELEQKDRPELDSRVLQGRVGLVAQPVGGWRLTADVGVWEPRGTEGDAVAIVTLDVAPPPRGRLRSSLSYRRTAFDATALLVDRGVGLQEMALEASARLEGGATVGGGLVATRLEGSEVNHRYLGTATWRFPLGSWIRSGAALRGFVFEKEQAEVMDGYWSPSSYLSLGFPVALAPSAGPVVPSLEISPGVQRIDQEGIEEPWSLTFRVEAALRVDLGPRRQLRLSGLVANSALQQLSPTAASDYQYRSVSLWLAWAF